jgi:hypothetical protein
MSSATEVQPAKQHTKDASLIERVLSRCDIRTEGYATPCWISDRATQPNGYTKIGVNHRTMLTHRAAYEAAFGSIPIGMVLDHLCRNRACANPEHLDPVTHRENLLRGEGPTSREAAQTHCIANHPFSVDNTRITSKGKRACRECDRHRAAGYRARSRAQHTTDAPLRAQEFDPIQGHSA